MNEVLKGSFFSFLLKIIGMLISYILILIISKQYGAEGVGLYNLTFNTISLLSIIAALGLNASMLRFVGQFNNDGELYKIKNLHANAMRITLPIAIIIAILLYHLSEYVSEVIFDNLNYVTPLKLGAIVIPFFVIQLINIEFLRGLKKIKVSEFFRNVYIPTFNTLAILLVGLFITIELLPIYTLGLAVISSSIINFAIIFKANLKIQSPVKKDNLLKTELIKTSLPMMITHLSSFLINTSSLFMLELFSSTEETGVFSVAFKLAMTVNIALIVVNTISGPKISELFWGDKLLDLQKILNFSTKLVFIISLVISVFLYAFSTPILTLFGTEFLAGRDALIILIAGQLVAAGSGTSLIFMNMTGNEKALRNIIMLSVIGILLLNYILIPIYGINGAAISSTIILILLNVIAAGYTKFKLGYITFYFPFISNNKT